MGRPFTHGPSNPGGGVVSRPSRRSGLSLIEVLVALFIVGLAVSPLIGLFRSGRQATQANTEKVQAVYLAQKALEQVKREANVRFDSLVSVNRPAPLIAERIKDICYYFRRVDVFGHTLGNRHAFPYLCKLLKGYSCTVEVGPYGNLANLKHVKVTIYYPRSHARGEGSYAIETLISRRSLF